MAIDSLAKRYSAINIGEESLTFPQPDGAIAGVERQHLLGLYSGISVSAGVISPYYYLQLLGE